ncbi:MAG: amidase [Deltaproteobacteria bacterium]|nr:amidase [Deltaproteobacteria bacterium]
MTGTADGSAARPEDGVLAALECAERIGPELNAFVALHRDRALAEARRASGPLAASPVAIKDNIDEAGCVCAAGCAAYLDRRPEQDAEVVQRLRAAGAVIIGRCNMHELADGVTSEASAFGPVHNPWRPGFTPGGSSGGSAACVAAGCVKISLGTDTGGSIRIPASLCGVVGFKPSAGRVPTRGVMPLSTSLDHVGPLAISVPEAARAMAVLADGWSAQRAAASPPRGVRIGVLEGFGREAEPGVGSCFDEALALLERAGAMLLPARIDDLARGLGLLSAIYAPEAAAYHEKRLAERPGDFGEAVREDLRRGLAADPGRRERALAERAELAAAVLGLMDELCLELLACPTTPCTALPHGAPAPHRYLQFTCPFNLTGQPAASVPAGLFGGLPVGLQLVGRQGADEQVLAAAADLEQRLGFVCAPVIRP